MWWVELAVYNFWMMARVKSVVLLLPPMSGVL